MTDFLNLEQVNQIITAGLSTMETRVAPGKELGIGNPEVIKTSGAYGSVILCALFTGGVEGRLTWTMEWGTGFAIAEILTGKKVDGFNEQTQQALEGLFHDFLQGVANGFSEKGTQLDIRVLPTLVDTSVLLSEDGNPGAIKIPFLLEGGSQVNLFLSLQEGNSIPLPAPDPNLDVVAQVATEAPGEVPAEAAAEVAAEAPVEDPAGALPTTPEENAVAPEELDPAAQMAAMEVPAEAVAEVSGEVVAEAAPEGAPGDVDAAAAAAAESLLQQMAAEAAGGETPVAAAPAEETPEGGDGTPPAAAA